MKCNVIWTKKNVSWIFQQMMNNTFSKYSFILVYIDDILIFFSYSFEEHVQHLELVFKELISHGLIVSKKVTKSI